MAASAFAAAWCALGVVGASGHSRCLAANDSPMYDAGSSTHDATTTDAAHDGSSPRAHTLYALDALLKKTSVPTCEKPQFLWDEIGLKGLYRGDGLTYDDDGRPGNREFLARQMPLSAIEGAVIVDVVPSRG